MELETLSEKTIFSAFSGKHAAADDNKGLNIMDYRDNVIYVWDNAAGLVLTQGLNSNCSHHQELSPTEQPSFQVTQISVNHSGTKVALWGSSGISIVDLPWRCGPRLEFQDGKGKIIVKCRQLELLDLGMNDEILQVKWQPAFQDNSDLCILTADNTLSYISCSGQNYYLSNVVRIGNRPLSRHKTLSVLGETAVDFDFVPLSVEPEDCTGVVVLLGNGDVCYFKGGDENEVQVLPISPLTDDNSLSEACSILVVPGKPPAVVITTSRGVIYHALLVALDVEQLVASGQPHLFRLLVLESVDLDAGLNLHSEDFNYLPIRLLHDEGHLRRYIVVHPAGVHSIVMEILVGVRKLIDASEDALDSQILDSVSSKKMPESTVEHLICTSRPLQGCVVFPGALLAIDSDGEITQLTMRSVELQPLKLYEGDSSINSNSESPLTQQLRKSFEHQIEQMINDSRVLPRMRFPPKDMPQDQLLALVVRMGNLVRKFTIPRYRQIRTILTQRAHLINTMQELQLQEIARLEGERVSITEAAETFGERIQTIVDELEDQRERVLRVVRRIAEVKPMPSDAERRMETIVAEIEKKVDGYDETLQKLKKNRAYQDSKIIDETESHQMSLSEKQAEIIRSCLTVMGENIAQVVRKVNEINSMLGLSPE